MPGWHSGMKLTKEHYEAMEAGRIRALAEKKAAREAEATEAKEAAKHKNAVVTRSRTHRPSGKTVGDKWREDLLVEFPMDEHDPRMATVRLVAEALDRAEMAERCIREEGILSAGIHGPKISPAVSIKKAAVEEANRGMRMLGLHPAGKTPEAAAMGWGQ